MSAIVVLLLCVAVVFPAVSQIEVLPLDDLSSFRDPPKSWQIVGDVRAELQKDNKLVTSQGKGVLVNMPAKRAPGEDIYTRFEHGDMDLELDFMMARESNSGIYLMGLYEIQLHDSWGVQEPTAAHLGGIYERWDESRPSGAKGYEGYAPRQNVSRAPGIWQHLKVSFQAPRFDEDGNKIENARLLRVELNGVLVQENVELSGPTRGAISQQENAEGPLRLQGDHGAVAFRNIRMALYEKPRPELHDLEYSIYQGRFDVVPDFEALPPEYEGRSVMLTSDLSPRSQQFLIRYLGKLEVKEAGDYSFRMRVPGGAGLLRVGEQEVIPLSEGNETGTLSLEAGTFPFELLYSKYVDWVEPGLGLSISAPGLRDYLISDQNVGLDNPVDPIIVEPQEAPLLRSFMDLPDGPRITHAVSVGSPQQVHYTYDMDHGTIVQLWRGGFLDATPMWYQRGDGSSRPLGSILHLVAEPELTLAKLPSQQAAWLTDTAGSSYRPKGYILKENDRPAFRYLIYDTEVEDASRVIEEGRGIQRELKIKQPGSDMYVRLVKGDDVQQIGKGIYLVDDKSYYLRIDNAGGAKPVIRTVADGQELIIPAREQLTYSILF